MSPVSLRLAAARADIRSMKLSLRGLVSRTPRENKTLNPEMRRLLNSYEPLHPESASDDERESDEAPAGQQDEQRSVA